MHEADDPRMPPPHLLAALRVPRFLQRYRLWKLRGRQGPVPDANWGPNGEVIILDDPEEQWGDEVLPRQGTGAPPPHILQALWEDDRELAMANDAGKDEPRAGAGKPARFPLYPSPEYILDQLRKTGRLREPDEDARAGAVQEPKLADRVPVGPVARPVLGPHPKAVSKGRPRLANPIHRKLSDRGMERIVRRLAREKGVKGADE
jgi:hypothetical protein